jgi:hypothetical protein
MAEGFENAGVRMGVPPHRPLWVASLAAALTATFVAFACILIFYAYDNAKVRCDHCVPALNLFTFEWWADVAVIFPYLAGVTIAYAVSLFAILVCLERRPMSRRLPWPLVGVLAMVPSACIWIVLIASKDPVAPIRTSAIPFVCMAVMGMIGGWVAGAVRRDRRA